MLSYSSKVVLIVEGSVSDGFGVWEAGIREGGRHKGVDM